jgi:hypothetical protein
MLCCEVLVLQMLVKPDVRRGRICILKFAKMALHEILLSSYKRQVKVSLI